MTAARDTGRRRSAASTGRDRPAAPARRGGPAAPVDRGAAVVEFLAAALLLLVPVLYLVLVLGRLQAATFAAEGAAREAGRSFTTSPTRDGAAARAVASVRIALDDQGFTTVDAASALDLACSTTPCLEPGSDVVVTVAFDVALPAVPAVVQGVVPLAIGVSATHLAPVDAFGARS